MEGMLSAAFFFSPILGKRHNPYVQSIPFNLIFFLCEPLQATISHMCRYRWISSHPPEAPFSLPPPNPSHSLYTPHKMETHSLIESTHHSRPSASPEQRNNAFACDITEVPLSHEKCPQCKGKTYSFTSYFHNPKVFKHPPHELLTFIETSYALKDRLHSLLSNFVSRQVDCEDIAEAEFLVNNWETDVFQLAKAVEEYSKECGHVKDFLEEAMNWSKELGRQIVGNLQGNRGPETPNGGLKEVLSEFRKKWERVWVAIVSEKSGKIHLPITRELEGVKAYRGDSN